VIATAKPLNRTSKQFIKDCMSDLSRRVPVSIRRIDLCICSVASLMGWHGNGRLKYPNAVSFVPAQPKDRPFQNLEGSTERLV
jgi:hypothetical protein